VRSMLVVNAGEKAHESLPSGESINTSIEHSSLHSQSLSHMSGQVPASPLTTQDFAGVVFTVVEH
jgi:hypothetical protein